MLGLTTVTPKLGLLIVGAINEHYPHPEDFAESREQGCCIINCGICSSLSWYMNYDRDTIEDSVRQTWYATENWAYWDAKRHSLKWSWLAEFWSTHKGCSRTVLANMEVQYSCE